MKSLMLNSSILKRVNRLKKPPGSLFFNGVDPTDLTRKPCVAVVGTRKPTTYGIDITEKVVAELTREGVVIISGLAFGIDIIAHRSALAARGHTIAVLASDVDNVYPSSHKSIARMIEDNGTLLSEHKNNARPKAYQFLERNRVIAALSDAVVIPEAAERSGSLNTARHALEMHIPVFAAPGRTTDPMSAGTNQLIAAGNARALTSGTTILSELGIQSTNGSARLPVGMNKVQRSIYTTIQHGAADIALIQHEVGVETTPLLTALTELEIEGLITQNSLGQWRITNTQ